MDQNRFEQELIYYIEKYDFSEEIDRLDSHLNLFKLTLNDKVTMEKNWVLLFKKLEEK